MTKHETAKLEGTLLDLAVAICEGLIPVPGKPGYVYHGDFGDDFIRFSPSTDWSQGGPIIERHGITIIHSPASGLWCGSISKDSAGIMGMEAETPLVAAMRALVAAKFGEWVEL